MTWGAVISGVVGIAGSAYASKKQKKANKGQRALEQELMQTSRETRPIGMDMLKKSQTNLDLYDDFYRKLARGDRQSAMELLAPELGSADRQEQEAFNADLQLGGRGGGSNERRLDLRDSRVGARNNALMGLRTGAVNQLGNVGFQRGSLGSAILGQASSSGLGVLGQMQNRLANEFDQGRQAAQGWSNIAGNIVNGWQSRGKTEQLPVNSKQFDLTPAESLPNRSYTPSSYLKPR